MAITSLRIADFRNLTDVLLSPCEFGLNILYGNNGSGKTSLLEAIHYVGSGRSFRGGNANQLIRHQMNKFVIFTELTNDAERQIPLGVERGLHGSLRMRAAEKEVTSIAELAAFLPIRVINSQSHNLFEAGPLFRRKFLDWGLFYETNNFIHCWRHFERSLKQRNILLRDKCPKSELDAWTEELVKYGLELNQLRQQYVQNFIPYIAETVQALLNISDLQINYYQGWDESEDYRTVLAEYYLDEWRSGHTQFGPHRADLDITIDAIPVKHFLSRGQQKLLVCAMILAQGMMLTKLTNKQVIYLVDDLPSELDSLGRKKLISLLAKQQTQIFITAIEKETICNFNEVKPELMKVFHVEHGCIEEVRVETALACSV